MKLSTIMSDIIGIGSAIIVGLVILFMAGWLERIEKKIDEENKNETIEDSEKK